MLTKLKLALLISAPLAGAATYAAAQGDGHKKEMIQKFDANGDGALDDAERAQLGAAFKAKRAEHRARMLAQYDANQDGSLDSAERTAMREAKLAERFAKLDKNGDGAVTLEEFKAAPMKGHHGRFGHGRGHHGQGKTRGTGAKL
jgi:hypothetical protein